jgi:hypothetical protein
MLASILTVTFDISNSAVDDKELRYDHNPIYVGNVGKLRDNHNNVSIIIISQLLTD